MRGLADLAELEQIPGVVGAISGKALLDGVMSLEDSAVRSALMDAGDGLGPATAWGSKGGRSDRREQAVPPS